MRGTVLFVAILLLVGWATALASGAARTWDFEDNLYRVTNGTRRQIKGWNGKVSTNTWHTLAIEARGDRLQVFWDGKAIIETTDGTLKDAGKVGVWTKADSVTHFDALTATPF